MSHYSKFSVFLLLLLYLVFPKQASALEQSAQFAQVSQSLGVEVRLLCESGCGREPGTVVTPEKIIMHVTEGAMTKAEGEWQYFNSGSEGRGVGSHYIIGVAGDTIQAVIMGDTQVEFAHTVGGYKEHISIEMQSRRSYDSKDEMPEAQYKAAYDLVRALMQQYNIPLGNVEYDTNYPDDSGVYGHYQLAPGMKTDPGAGWLRDFREDLKAGGALPTTGSSSGSRTSTSCWITEVGDAPDDDKPVCQTSSVGPGGPCQKAPAPPDRSLIRQAIIDKWGIELNLTEDQLVLAWEEFHEIDCTGLLQDLRGTLVGSWDRAYAQQFSQPGTSGEHGEIDIMFSNQWGGEFMKAILVHELTHVWQHYAPRGEQNLLDNNDAFAQEGGLTKYSRNECPDFTSNTPNKEDHADTIALYLNPEQGELTCGGGAPNPFANGAHPLHRASAEKGVGSGSGGTQQTSGRNTPLP